MPWFRLQDQQCRVWEVNSDEIAAIIRSNIYQTRLVERGRMVTHTPDFIDSFFLPTTYSFEVDTQQAERAANTEAPLYIRDSWDQAHLNGEGFLGTLVGMRRAAVVAGERFRSLINQASGQSQQNMIRAVARDQAIIDGTTALRNASAGVLITGATVLSGGAALAAAGAGGALRFTGRVQDGGTVSQAAQETAIDLFVAFVTRGVTRGMPAASALNPARNLQNASAVALFGIFTNTTADIAKSIVTGSIGRTPIQGAQARLGVEIVNTLTGVLLSRVGLPVSLTSPHREATDAIVGMTTGYIGDQIVDAARGTSSPTDNSSRGNVPANTLLYTNPALEAAEEWVRSRAMRRV